MTKLFCALGLHPNLKLVILSSLPDPIQVAVNQALQTRNRDILQITIGELQQEVFIALEDICNRREIFKDYLHGDKIIDKACDDSYLKHKCTKDQFCDCHTKKMKYFKRHSFPRNTSRRKKRVKPQWRYLKKKKRKSIKSDHCFICNQKWHFSKNCPKNKQAKKMAQMIRQSGIKIQKEDDIESVCSIEDKPSNSTICAIPFQFPIYSKPITIIAFIDTGAAETIMNPDVLPPEWWKPHKNEDINPTKASHQGMNPDHLLLAKQECQELQQQDLIEPSDSQWACEAFYVNKRSEQIRGKLILVINYQPLNYFLQNDKFPLPNKDLLFSSLAKARVFSKFDLKVGFWKLGILPDDRLKTGFCIPNRHFQWKVMPFGLKIAPSLFQKVMIKVFHPLMKNALVYIDDILLYSRDEESHAELLEDFKSLVHKYGIMLSERKMLINKSEIEFLGMDIKDGRYSPGPHIAQKLLKFPSKNLSFKQTQQFVGIVNYLRNFIPKVSKYLNLLTKILKKNPPLWSSSQTRAVQRLKELTKDLPPLQILADGKRIL
ncbi:hypothetical protein CXB51_026542 [Gossypium anomalum]|uniref:Reverse transcriptase domain-containing protein n=1 Tax=Gossypium anomalum TaxID=47600 RepID=A0A8J6CR68_9ROSI|nr:hypothetical protein CXB51_026542 [Gossypium anomalum]